jgi:hypothetical protein
MKELTITGFCTWKFAATFPVDTYAVKMSVAETLIYTNIGGALGTIIFILLSDSLILKYRINTCRKICFSGLKKRKSVRRETGG